jgi:hypothetical protein
VWGWWNNDIFRWKFHCEWIRWWQRFRLGWEIPSVWRLWLASLCLLPPLLGEVDLCELRGGVEVDVLHMLLAEVPSRVGADVGEAAPLVHAEFANADFDVEAVIVLCIYTAI